MLKTVDYYGVHELNSGVRFLVQPQGATHALDMSIPLDVKVRTPLKCPHGIDLRRTVEAELPDDPLVKLFLPIPKPDGRPITYLTDSRQNIELVRQLLRLSSPTAAGVVRPLWAKTRETELNSTNLMPYVASGYSFSVNRVLQQLEAAAPWSRRPLVVLMPEWFAVTKQGYQVPTIVPESVASLPLEQVGAWYLRQYLRHELATEDA